ncbi:MAG: hypothetical protein HETSPECPRED_006476 [Heterodermia speciosa]|uniref:Cytochrome P450 n=1 Tax=Heterodermia speciosa TaxID=116794 RepID=A0A8H3FNE1_9LECA|nr:MAG: hypothetical protein HETSPECPRED_006476 [Heterodermia speciosa]
MIGGYGPFEQLYVVAKWALVSLILLFTIKTVVTAVYNVYYHPLSKFPGPKSAAATPLPFVRRLITGHWVEWTTALHEKYGEVVRIHPDELSFISPSAWQDIFASRPQLPKPKIGVIEVANGVPNLGTTDDFDVHARQRKILGNALSDRALREQEYILKRYTDLLIEKFREQITNQKGKPATVDVCRWYNYTTFDTVGDLQFGDSFNALSTSEEHPWVSAIFHGLKFGMLLTVFHHFPPLKARWVLPQIVMDKAREHFDWGCQRIEKRVQTETDRPDFMHHLLQNMDDEKGMSRDEINSTATFLILAGSDTSATTCTATTWFLLKNPRVLKRLQAEVRESFQNYEDISVSSAARLPYLHAVIQEVLRLHPTGPISVPRLVNRPNTIISGHLVPEGTRVGIPQKTAFRSPVNFVEPMAFNPERWLKDADSRFDADRKDAYEPFMVGPRNCLGKSLAWAEMNLILTKVIWSFDLELGEGNKDDWSDQRVWLLHEKAPLYVKISPRGS